MQTIGRTRSGSCARTMALPRIVSEFLLSIFICPDLQVAIRFVKAPREDIVENVVRYNNSQDKLQAADFRSTDPIQDRLRTEFDSIPDADYESGRRGRN